MKLIDYINIKEGDIILEYNPNTSSMNKKSILFVRITEIPKNDMMKIGKSLYWQGTDEFGNTFINTDELNCWISKRGDLTHYKMDREEICRLLMDVI